MTRFLIVEDHQLYVGALERELKLLRPSALCHRALNLGSAITLLASASSYDLAFLDLKLPDAEGVEVVKAVLNASPSLKVAVISGYENPRLMRQVFEAGVIGFLPKRLELSAFRDVLSSLLSGGFYFPPEALAARPFTDELQSLTPRERQVLDQLVSGQSTKLIARKLGLAPTTVDKHIDQIRAKVGSTTRMQLVARIRELLTELR